MLVIVSRSLRESRRALIGWTVGVSVFLSVYLFAAYPSLVGDPSLAGQMARVKFPGAMRDLMGGLADFTTAAGYLQTLIYQLFGPMLFIGCATGLANRAIAGPEESGTLELTMALPLTRGRLVAERLAAMALGLLAMAAVTLLVAWAAVVSNGMNVPFGRLLAAHLGVYLVALLCGTLCLLAGAATGSKGIALSVVGVAAVGGYVVETLGKQVPVLEWARWISPFHYYLEGRPIHDGLPVVDYLVLLGATAVLAVGAILAFDRRDVGV
ncbi:ABC transporter permease subunit [Spongiactinospora sp. TRM90649]|uniref:ABC transporter permease subunit n=1 Tax=Spongiactinospora sp. TRM90649 TaxID=3031114 RepID=UPI0023F6BBC7|nr:ABC transporter permease subunit [Spongiactinospora sp. TRM90649]MDF5758682.1 ABC transporter permease subunit [Spongiactinospora sp. TRM90649]